ncbi:MAG: ribonuclease R [Clostridiales bacterium]|nr:ribonuclease R [Clostridiales bacterium]
MKDRVLAFLRTAEKAVDAFDLAEALSAPAGEVATALSELVGEGAIVLTRKGKYQTSEDAGLTLCRVVVVRSGAPIARPLNGGDDLRIVKRGELRPLPDDLVLVRAEPRAEGEPGRCQLVAIVRRSRDRFSATLRISALRDRKERRKGTATYQVEALPTDRRITCDIELVGGLRGAEDGDLVLLRVVGWPERGVPLRAQVEELLGDAGDIGAQLQALAVRHRLPRAFSPDALREAESLPADVDQADLAGRDDLRGLTLFTIDGDDAKDFDDAVSLTPIDGGWRLGVHIADVSHYVARGRPIDRDAEERGTSVYLPGLTLPMLPEALSNRLCSLMPEVDRLALSLTMDIVGGAVVDHHLAASVIHSAARLTYDQVNRLFEGRESAVPQPLRPVLFDMLALSKSLRAARRSRGSIDFDIAEPVFTLDRAGRPTDVRARNRGEAERLIEDFMLLANETVAALARSVSLPFLYRVHGKPDPDRLDELAEFLNGLGIRPRFSKQPHPLQFQKILDEVAGSAEEGLVKQVMLRSLRRAAYSEKPEGHFGLAAGDYCHFTSPIRRYPDLEVHRMLKLLLSGDAGWVKWEGRMPALAALCSRREQAATEAERDADDLLKAYYMAGHVGEVFDGVVSGVTGWGFYVTLANTVEGLVHARTLDGQFTTDAARHALTSGGGRGVRLGDAVRVSVERVSPSAGEIDFALVGRMPRLRDRGRRRETED